MNLTSSASRPLVLDPPVAGYSLRWLPILALVLVIGGAVLRFTALDTRPFWHDEATTAMTHGGYSRNQISREFNGREMRAADLVYYQQLRPDLSVVHTVASLAREESQISPLYYALGRSWVEFWGQSIVTLRAWSAVWGVLALPLVYWLARDLFASWPVAWTALALGAVAPFFFYYAREAREYSMWAAVILLSSALVLRAERLDTRAWWAAYAVSVAVGLYTHAFFAFVVVGHAAWLLLVTVCPNWRMWRAHPIVRRYLVSVLVGSTLFLPWALVLLINLRRVYGNTRWTSEGLGWLGSLERALLGWGRVLLDDSERLPAALSLSLAVLSIALVSGAVWAVYRYTPRRTWLFVLMMILAPALALLVPDLLLGGRRFTVVRYLTPSFLGAQLAVAYLLGTGIQGRHRLAWLSLLLGVLLGGAVSCVGLVVRDPRTMSGTSHGNPDVALVLNQASQPLLISDPHGTNFYNLLALSHYLDGDVRLQLVNDPQQLTLPSIMDEVYAFNVDDPIRRKLEAEGYRLEATPGAGLFRVLR